MRLHTGRRPAAARRGATLVEAAFVLPIFLLFVFGVFEYGRYLLVLQVSTNAAREGARWAAVHGSDLRENDTRFVPPANYPLFRVHPDDPVPQSGEVKYANRTVYQVPFVEYYVKDRMGGVDRMISGFAVRVFACDQDELDGKPAGAAAEILPRLDTDPDTGVVSKSWKAPFPQKIAVKIVGLYKPILPGFLFITDPIPVATVALTTGEG